MKKEIRRELSFIIKKNIWFSMFVIFFVLCGCSQIPVNQKVIELNLANLAPLTSPELSSFPLAKKTFI